MYSVGPIAIPKYMPPLFGRGFKDETSPEISILSFSVTDVSNNVNVLPESKPSNTKRGIVTFPALLIIKVVASAGKTD